MAREKSHQPDDLSARLRASLRQKRPWPWTGPVLLVAGVVLFIILLVLVFRPAANPPPLLVFAHDALALTAEATTLEAWVETIPPIPDKMNLAGVELQFEAGGLHDSKIIGKAATDNSGRARLSWSSPTAVTNWTARFLGDKSRRGAHYPARLYCLPQKSALLFVDVTALSGADAATWEKSRGLDIPPWPGCGAALQAAAQQNFQIVYLAAPGSYPRLRGWVEQQIHGHERLPFGPVLPLKEAKGIQTLEEIEKTWGKRFSGSHVYLVDRTRGSDALPAAAIKVVMVSGMPPPPGIIAVPSWPELTKHLPIINPTVQDAKNRQ